MQSSVERIPSCRCRHPHLTLARTLARYSVERVKNLPPLPLGDQPPPHEALHVHRWSGENAFFMFSHRDHLAIGSGGHFGLWLDAELLHGDPLPQLRRRRRAPPQPRTERHASSPHPHPHPHRNPYPGTSGPSDTFRNDCLCRPSGSRAGSDAAVDAASGEAAVVGEFRCEVLEVC